MKKKMIWVAGILIATSAYAQTDVSTGIMRGKDYGVTYLLPKTEIEIVVQATKHTYMPGEFCKYADRYLRMNNVSADPNIYWTIDKVQTHVAGVPDKDNVYFVKLRLSSMILSWAPSCGILSASPRRRAFLLSRML